MTDRYEKLKAWAIQAAVLIVLSILLSLIQRYLGITIEVPPPPAMTVLVVQPDATGEIDVTVFPTTKEK